MDKGIFEKEDFAGVGETVNEMDQQEASINMAANMLNSTNGSGNTEEVTESQSKMSEISDEDEELAEQMLFKGYAEKEVVIPVFKKKGTSITVCTTTPQEVSLINEIVFGIIKEHRNDEGEIDIPEIEITTLKASYVTSLSFIGINGKDICEDRTVSKAAVLKSAIVKMNEMYSDGNMTQGDSLKESILKSLRYRVQEVKKFPTPILDFISDEKYRFENRMFEIMNGDSIVPK